MAGRREKREVMLTERKSGDGEDGIQAVSQQQMLYITVGYCKVLTIPGDQMVCHSWKPVTTVGKCTVPTKNILQTAPSKWRVGTRTVEKPVSSNIEVRQELIGK